MSKSKNPVALFNEGSSGFGRATAIKLAASDWQAVGAFRGRGLEFNATAAALAGHGIDSIEHVTDTDSVAWVVADVVARFGRIDAVVNAAGYGLLGPMENTTLEPVMCAQGSGRIVNIGPDVGYRANYFQSSYTTSKFAVDSFGQSLRLEMRHFGISISLVSPGGYDTEFGQLVVTKFASGDKAPLQNDLVQLYRMDSRPSREPVVRG